MPLVLAEVGYVYGRGGRRTKAESTLRRLDELARVQHVPAVYRARIYAGLGDREQGLAALERAAQDRDFDLAWGLPGAFKAFKGDPRYEALSRRLSVPRESGKL